MPPGSVTPFDSVRVEPPDLPVREIEMNVVSFAPGTIDTVVMPPLAGRMFGGGDSSNTCTVVVVNETAHRDLFGSDAVGRLIQDPTGADVEIIGVVGNREPRDGRKVPPAVYYYAEQTGPPGGVQGPAVFRVPDRPADPGSSVLDARIVSPEYFAATGLAVMAGATFANEPALRGCRVGVLNEEAADLYFGGKAVGGAVIDEWGRRTQIIGVVRPAALRTSQRRTEPAIFTPMTQDFVPRMTLVIGTRRADEETLRTVRRRLEAVSGGRVLAGSVLTLEALLARTALATERIATVLVGAVAAIALALGALGTYGALSEFARQRRREFAIRIALGAPRSRRSAGAGGRSSPRCRGDPRRCGRRAPGRALAGRAHVLGRITGPVDLVERPRRAAPGGCDGQRAAGAPCHDGEPPLDHA